jgi:hypothetical protein
MIRRAGPILATMDIGTGVLERISERPTAPAMLALEEER